LPADLFYNTKSSTFVKQHFHQLGCWNKIGYYYSYWGKANLFRN
jgi:hypothetical protein